MPLYLSIEDGHQIAGPRTTVAKRIEGGDARAKQGGRFNVRQIVRNPRQSFYGSNHMRGIASVIANSRH
jgi:hypothetical protein